MQANSEVAPTEDSISSLGPEEAAALKERASQLASPTAENPLEPVDEAKDEEPATEAAPEEEAVEEKAEAAAAATGGQPAAAAVDDLSEDEDSALEAASSDTDTEELMSGAAGGFANAKPFQESEFGKIDGRDQTLKKVKFTNSHQIYVFATKRIKNLKIHSEQFHKFIVAIVEAVKYRCDSLEKMLESFGEKGPKSKTGKYVTGSEELVDNVRKAIHFELQYYSKAYKDVLQPLMKKLGEQTEKLTKDFDTLTASATALQNLHNSAEALLRKKMGIYCSEAQKSGKEFFVAARVYKHCVMEYHRIFRIYIPNLQKVLTCLEYLEQQKKENDLVVQRKFMDCLLDIQFKVTKDLKRVSRKARALDPEKEWDQVMDEIHFIQEDGRTLFDSIVPCRSAALIHAWLARDIVMDVVVGYRTKMTAWQTVFASVTRAGFMHLFKDKKKTNPIAALILQDYDVEEDTSKETSITLVPTDTGLLQNLKLFQGHVYLSCKTKTEKTELLKKIRDFKAQFGDLEYSGGPGTGDQSQEEYGAAQLVKV